MADRASIRTMYAIVDMMYDAFLVAGFGYLTYKSLDVIPLLKAE